MQAHGCQLAIDSDRGDIAFRMRRWGGYAATAVVAAILSGCAPLTPASDAAVSTRSQALANPRDGTDLLAQMAPRPSRYALDPAQAVQEHLDSLELPEVDQQGVASWYGPGFHGRKTANGERYNQYELTAAHPQYAFNTQLCVRNSGNGRTVVVRVNDRGPFTGNRVIDLSKAAAEEIGMLGQGLKRVEIYKLDEGQEECPEALVALNN